MGGEETEIGDATTTVLLEAANFEPYGIYRTSERHAAAHRGLEPLGEGRRPVPRRAGGRPRDAAHRRARRRALDRRTPTSTASCPSGRVVRFRPERADALIGIEIAARRAGRAPRDASASSVDERRRRRPDLARARRDARDRRGRGDRPLPARRRARSRCRAGARCSAGSRASSGCAAGSRTSLVGLGFAETYTPSPAPDDRPGRVEAARADLGRADRAPHDAAPEPRRGRPRATSTPGTSGSRCSRSRASTCPTAASLPDERMRVAGDRRGRLLPREGRRRGALRGAQGRAARSSAAEHPLLHPGQGGAHRARASSASCIPRLLEGDVGRVRARPRRRSSRQSREPVTYEDVISYPAVRQDLAFVVAEDVAAGDLVAAAREAAGPGAARDARLRRLPRRRRSARAASRSRSRVAFQSPERTLSDEDAAVLRQRIVDALASGSAPS